MRPIRQLNMCVIVFPGWVDDASCCYGWWYGIITGMCQWLRAVLLHKCLLAYARTYRTWREPSDASCMGKSTSVAEGSFVMRVSACACLAYARTYRTWREPSDTSCMGKSTSVAEGSFAMQASARTCSDSSHMAHKP